MTVDVYLDTAFDREHELIAGKPLPFPSAALHPRFSSTDPVTYSTPR